MAEGVAGAGGTVITDGVFDDPEHQPAPDAAKAPKGWTWDRENRHWKPKVRGPVLAALRGRERQVPDDRRADGGPDRDGTPGDGAGQEPAAGEAPDVYRDPDPAWGAGDRETTPIDTFTLDRETRADIRALIALAYTIPGETLPLLDPYCFGPLAEEDTAKGVIGAVSDIVCGSPRVAKWAASAAGLMPWIKLGIALQPVA